MSNFRITYNYPWLLLLIIPALLLTLIPYFRMEKRYRGTRNRIISMTLHSLAMIIAINLLAGVGFAYEMPNEDNEIILLVDTSDSAAAHGEEIEDFIDSVLKVSAEECKIGIVKLGYGCKYAVRLTEDTDGVLEKYRLSEDPDGTATSLADALKYTASLFTQPKSAKIVVVSDGIETDGDALLALRDIVATGITVDTLTLSGAEVRDIQIVSAETEENIVVGEDFVTRLTVMANSLTDEEVAILRLYDGDELIGETPVGLENGINEIPVSLSLSKSGVHELTFELITDYELFGEPLGDDIAENNVYRTYVQLRQLNSILLIERREGDGAILKEILSENKTVTDFSIESDIDALPVTLADIAAFDETVLVNIAYSDMPEGFEELLHRYVYELGGGLFTVGGENDVINGDTVPHAYNRKDIENSVYLKQMLPVRAEDYTPPIAVMIVVDTSTSMNKNGKLDAAIDGARACLDALHDRDFCGVVAFNSASSEKQSVLPVSKRDIIEESIKQIKEGGGLGGGTMFSDAIMKAGRALSVINNVERRHIILVTDGIPNDTFADYGSYISDNVSDEITMSVITIGLSDPTKQVDMQKAANAGGGGYYNVSGASEVAGKMYDDLTQEAIREIEYGQPFALTVKDRSTILTGIDPKAIPKLRGYYGTVAKKSATVPLMGEHVPIYAFHEYGEGKVGSFMCDLSGIWSADFTSDIVGRALINNIADSLYKGAPISTDGIKYELKSDNYAHRLNVYGAGAGERVEVTVEPLSAHLQHLFGEIEVSAEESGRRFAFNLSEAGLYEIKISVFDAEGEPLLEKVTYRALSYSEEYDTLSASAASGEELMELIVSVGGGVTVSDPVDVFDGLLRSITHSVDPRLWLLITAIALVLLDIAVRKFKFKWIHELIRERRAAK